MKKRWRRGEIDISHFSFQSHFGDRIWVPPPNLSTFPSPDALQGRIIIKGQQLTERFDSVRGDEDREKEEKRKVENELKRDADSMLRTQILVLQQLQVMIEGPFVIGGEAVVVRCVRRGSGLGEPEEVKGDEMRSEVLSDYMNFLHNTARFIREMDVIAESASYQALGESTTRLNATLAEVFNGEKKLIEMSGKKKDAPKASTQDEGKVKAKPKSGEIARKKDRSLTASQLNQGCMSFIPFLFFFSFSFFFFLFFFFLFFYFLFFLFFFFIL
jgi:hypothetical protein